MALPSFDEFFLPFLQVLHEHGPTSLQQMREHLAIKLGVTEEEQLELLPSGRQRRYDNRVGWARTYLNKAGLIKTISRGVYELTPEGKSLVEQAPTPKVGVGTLRNYQAYREWEEASKTTSTVTSDASSSPSTGSDVTPEETISNAFQLLSETLASEITEALQGVTWQRFEQIVVDVLISLGYGGSRGDAGHAFRTSGDGGVDGVINDDRLGLSKIYVQAKRYALDRKIGRPEVQAFVGSLLGQRARQGVFITTSGFSKDAENYVAGLSELKVILIDGTRLANLMIDFGVGVAEKDRYVIKRLDRDYFEE